MRNSTSQIEALTAVFAASSRPQFLIDSDRRMIVATTAAAAKLFGLPLEILRDQPVESRLKLADQHGLGLGVRADGSEIPLHVDQQTLPTSTGRFELWTLTPPENPAERENALQEYEAQFRSVFELPGVGMAQLDANTGRFLHVNDHFCKITGYTREELQQMRPADLTHVDDREQDQVLMERFFRQEIPWYFNEKRYVRKTGEVIWVQVNAALVMGPQGRIHRTSAVIHEITERKTAELALRANEEFLQQAMRVANLGIFDHDQEHDILTFSPEMRRLCGMSDEEPVSLPLWFERVHPEDREQVQAAVRAAHNPAGTGLYHVEHRIVLPNGSIRWLRVQAQTFFADRAEERRPIRTIGAALDITVEREWHSWMHSVNKQLEEKIHKRTEELDAQRKTALLMAQAAEKAKIRAEENAQALARANFELEQFAYIASHDLQEPLRKIQAFGDLVISTYGPQLDVQAQDYLERMGRAAQRMQTLINDLLSLSRVVRKGQPFEQVDLSAILSDVLSDLESRIQETAARIEVGRLPILEADPTQMRQLLQNLVGNALKYFRPGTAPWVSITGEPILGETWPTPALGEVTHWKIVVRDRGIGFDQQEAERIFQPFQRLHGRNEFEGTGMGLAICRRIVERHEGKIEAYGVRGEGSQFIVTLPVKHRLEGVSENEGPQGTDSNT